MKSPGGRCRCRVGAARVVVVQAIPCRTPVTHGGRSRAAVRGWRKGQLVARIEVMTHVEAPPDKVWAVLTDWQRQPEWMVDVRDITVTSAVDQGIGVTVRASTDVLGVVLSDELTVTEWEPEAVLGVRHLGWLIRGAGAIELTATPKGTRVVWWEESEAPLGALGDALAGLLIVPWVHRVFRRSLARLKRLCEVPPG